MPTLAVNLAACLALAVVFGTDMFFTVVGRAALARASATAVLEVMAHVHAVADRRMPVFGGAGIVGTALLVVLDPTVRGLAAISLVAQLLMLAVYATVSKPVNVQMAAALRAGVGAGEARALQVRWESVLIPRALLLAIGMGALLLALAKKGA